MRWVVVSLIATGVVAAWLFADEVLLTDVLSRSGVSSSGRLMQDLFRLLQRLGVGDECPVELAARKSEVRTKASSCSKGLATVSKYRSAEMKPPSRSKSVVGSSHDLLRCRDSASVAEKALESALSSAEQTCQRSANQSSVNVQQNFQRPAILAKSAEATMQSETLSGATPRKRGAVSVKHASDVLRTWAVELSASLESRPGAIWHCAETQHHDGARLKCWHKDAEVLKKAGCVGNHASTLEGLPTLCKSTAYEHQGSRCALVAVGNVDVASKIAEIRGCGGVGFEPKYSSPKFGGRSLVSLRGEALMIRRDGDFLATEELVLGPAELGRLWGYHVIDALLINCGGCEFAIADHFINDADFLQTVDQVSLTLHADSRRLWSTQHAENFGRLLLLLEESGHRLVHFELRSCTRVKSPCAAELTTSARADSALLHGLCCPEFLFVRIEEARDITYDVATSTTTSTTEEPPHSWRKKLWRDDQRCGAPHRLQQTGTGGKRFAECDPEGKIPCCSDSGHCGSTPLHCDCQQCYDYRRKGKYRDDCPLGKPFDPQMEGKIPPRRTESRIPKILHQVWLGSERLPPYWMETCKNMALDSGWEYMLWDDLRVDTVLGTQWRTYVRYKERFDFIGRADIVRYEILHRFGGVFMDADSACLRPIQWLHLNLKTDCWLSQEYHGWPGYAANGFIGCPAESKFMLELNKEIAKSKDINAGPAWIMVGPKFVNDLAKKHGGFGKLNVTVLPYCFFLPEHWHDMDNKQLRDRHIARTSSGMNTSDLLEEFRDEYQHSYTYQFWGTTFGSYVEVKKKPKVKTETDSKGENTLFREDYRCGLGFPVKSGRLAECDPDSDFWCCSENGWCGRTPQHCECDSCVNFKKRRNHPP